MEPAILLRGIERLLVVGSATLTIYLGFRLFVIGATAGKSVEAKTAFGRVVVGGTAPGLVFMTWGCSVLIYALLHGGAEVGTKTLKPAETQGEYQILKGLAR
jgi:hypothetical protein